MGAAVTLAAFPAPAKERSSEALLQRKDLLYLYTASGERIPAVHIKRGSVGTDRVLIYSHGNAEDLGQRLAYLDLLSKICGADVFAYEYCGYGLAEGTPSEDGCVACIEAAFQHLSKLFPPNRMIAFGRSIGAGPTLELALRHPEIRGVVLQSPPESCGRAVFGSFAWAGYHLDIFRNYEKIGDVACPVLVMHGTIDEIVPWQHGVALHKACRFAVPPLWVEDRGHNNMPNEVCLRRIREFFDELDGLSWGYSVFVNNLATDISVAL
mmetsp:Transcript_85799/g.188374  ORF Transcript_85799/g.188374 Transcript_85799/m.188374 type:complete len:267 (-) Transcript_85799:26-826(-)